MKIHQTPASIVNSAPFLHSGKFYALIIDVEVCALPRLGMNPKSLINPAT